MSMLLIQYRTKRCQRHRNSYVNISRPRAASHHQKLNNNQRDCITSQTFSINTKAKRLNPAQQQQQQWCNKLAQQAGLCVLWTINLLSHRHKPSSNGVSSSLFGEGPNIAGARYNPCSVSYMMGKQHIQILRATWSGFPRSGLEVGFLYPLIEPESE